MSEKIEIYVRPSGERILLNFYVPLALREKLIAGIQAGKFDGAGAEMHVELSVLPEWSNDRQLKKNLSALGPVHVRVPISTINFQFGEEE